MTWPRAKVEIEQLIVASFLRDAAAQSLLPFTVRSCKRNDEADLDFLIETDTGSRYLELMEIAPLAIHGGSYESLPTSNSPYELARWIVDRALGKSERYGARGTPKTLVLYATHWTLATSMTALSLLQYWFGTIAHNFERIYLCHPVRIDSSIVESVFPTLSTLPCDFDPERFRDATTHNLLPWEQASNGD